MPCCTAVLSNKGKYECFPLKLRLHLYFIYLGLISLSKVVFLVCGLTLISFLPLAVLHWQLGNLVKIILPNNKGANLAPLR